ncbi:hypothetical protein [Paenibacillus sp. DMB5]|nr:hypothetical protein [Paenibacillus sp. DMB5]
MANGKGLLEWTLVAEFLIPGWGNKSSLVPAAAKLSRQSPRSL